MRAQSTSIFIFTVSLILDASYVLLCLYRYSYSKLHVSYSKDTLIASFDKIMELSNPPWLPCSPLLPPVFKLPHGLRKHSLVGTWLGFTGQAECIQPVVTNSLHCHPGSIVPIVTQNQTHTRGRRLIGCTLECFHPPLHTAECWSSQPWVCATQSTVAYPYAHSGF